MQEDKKKQIRTMSIVVAILIYGIFIGVNFDPNVTEVQAKVAGDSPLGIPVRNFFIGLSALLFFPIFFIANHFVKISSFALEQGRSVKGLSTIIFMFSIGKEQPTDIRKSRNVVLFSLVYLILIFAIWIILASMKGV